MLETDNWMRQIVHLIAVGNSKLIFIPRVKDVYLIFGMNRHETTNE